MHVSVVWKTTHPSIFWELRRKNHKQNQRKELNCPQLHLQGATKSLFCT